MLMQKVGLGEILHHCITRGEQHWNTRNGPHISAPMMGAEQLRPVPCVQRSAIGCLLRGVAIATR